VDSRQRRAPAPKAAGGVEEDARVKVPEAEPAEPKAKRNHADDWTPEVEALLRDWQRRSTVAEHAYYSKAERLRVWNYLLGIPVVIVTGVVGTAVFASLGKSTTVSAHAKLAIGAVTILAAVLAGIQTFTKLGEAAQQNGIAGDWYASIRRDLEESLSLPLSLRDPPKKVVDETRKEMNKASQKSPELGERWWGPFARAYDVDDLRVQERILWWTGPPKKVTRRGRGPAPADQTDGGSPSTPSSPSVSG
jgi:hypothetical protein